MWTAWSARGTCSASRSAVEYTATASMSSSCSALITRTAISPRFATSTRENISGGPLDPERPAVGRLELEQKLAVLDGIRVRDVDSAYDPFDLGLHGVHQLHRLEDAQRLPLGHGVALLHERRLARRGRVVERADHRALDTPEPIARRRNRGLVELAGRRAHDRSDGVGGLLGGAAHADAHAVLLDGDLVDARLLHDLDDRADPLLATLLEALRTGRLGTGRALADRVQQ